MGVDSHSFNEYIATTAPLVGGVRPIVLFIVLGDSDLASTRLLRIPAAWISGQKKELLC